MDHKRVGPHWVKLGSSSKAGGCCYKLYNLVQRVILLPCQSSFYLSRSNKLTDRQIDRQTYGATTLCVAFPYFLPHDSTTRPAFSQLFSLKIRR